MSPLSASGSDPPKSVLLAKLELLLRDSAVARRFIRAGLGTLLLMFLGLMVAVLLETPKSHHPTPWAPEPIFSRIWWDAPRPDALHTEMPVHPLGEAGGFLPKDFCPPGAATLDRTCPGLARTNGGGLRMDGSGGGLWLHRLAPQPASKRLLAITLAGVVYERGQDSLWRLRELPESAQVAGASPPANAEDGKANISPQGTPGEVDQRLGQRRQQVQRQVPQATAAPQQQTQQSIPAARTGTVDALEGAQIVPILIGHQSRVTALAFSPDGKRLVSASDDGTLRIWDTATKSTVGAPLTGHRSAVSSVVISPDGKSIASASADSTVRLWHLDTGAPIDQPLTGHMGPVTSVAFSPDGKYLVSGSSDRTLRLWDAVSGRVIDRRFAGHEGQVHAVAYSPDGNRIASGSQDKTLRVWDPSTGVALGQPLAGHFQSVLFAAFSPDGARLLSASGEGWVWLWDREANSSSGVSGSGAKSPQPKAVFRSDGFPVVHDGAGAWYAKNPATGQSIGEPEKFFFSGDSENYATFAPDGRRIASTGADAFILWDAVTGRRYGPIFRGHSGRVLFAAFSPDGLQIATASADKTIRIWPAPDPPARIRDVALDVVGKGWAVGERGRISAIIDSVSIGSTFRGERPNAPDVVADFNAISHVRGDDFLAVGAAGTVLRLRGVYVRAGRLTPSLHPVSLPNTVGNRALHAVTFTADGTLGWIGGEAGVLLHSTDSGATWKQIPSNTTATVHAIHVEPGSNIGWAAARHSDGRAVVLHATNASEPTWRELPHHPAPTSYLLLAVVIPVLLLFNALAWRPMPPTPQTSIESRAAPERPITGTDPDPLQFKPIAVGLSRFLRNRNTAPPLTIAISGPWGSGKSSIMNLLAEDLDQHSGATVRFNAWHHKEEPHLFAALFENIRAQAIPRLYTWPGLVFRARLFLRRARRALVAALVIALALAIVGWIVQRAHPNLDLDRLRNSLGLNLKTAQDALKAFRLDGAAEALLAAVTGLGALGALAMLALWLHRHFAALPSAGTLMASLSAKARIADFSSQLSFRHRFGEALGEVCTLLRTGRSPGLVIFIDDLDRCPPPEVAKILEAVSFCLGAGPCTVVMGMDRRQVEFAVGLGFKDVVEGLPDDELDLHLNPESRHTPMVQHRRQAYARRYLEKLVNIEVAVPTMDQDALRALLGLEPDPATGAPVIAPFASGPGWLARTQRVVRGALANAPALAVLVVLGLATSYWLELRQYERAPAAAPAAISTPAPRLDRAAAPGTGAASAAAGAPSSQAAQPAQDAPARDITLVYATTNKSAVPGRGEFLWWGLSWLALLLAGIVGFGLWAQRRDSDVKDSPDFARALDAVQPLLALSCSTPRLVKRFQNRMRYLAERLRRQRPDIDWIAALVHAVERLLGRSWLPAAWFEAADTSLLPEDVLILLGAVEQAAPAAFRAADAALFSRPPADLPPGGEEAWHRTIQKYNDLKLRAPTPDHIRAYRDFVLPLLR